MNRLLLSQSIIVQSAFVALFMKGTIVDFINVCSKLLLGKEIEIIGLLVTIIASILLFFGMLSIVFKCKKFVMVSLLGFIFLWCISGILHPKTVEFLKDNATQFFFTCLPYMWIFYYMFYETNNKESKNYYINCIYKSSIVRTCIALVSQTIMFIFPSSDIYNDYMTAAYTILISAVFVLCYYMTRKHKSFLIKALVIMSPLYMLLLGCRGALLFYGAFVIIFKILKLDGNNNSSINILNFLYVSIFAAFSVVLLQGLVIILSKIDVNSHAVELIANSKFFTDSIRSELFGLLIDYILINPFGYGIFADRLIIPETNLFWEITYSHNILLELCIDFGYIGLPLFAYLVYVIYKSFIYAGTHQKVIILALFCSSFLKLLVSSSLWQEQMFYALLGVVFATYRMPINICT